MRDTMAVAGWVGGAMLISVSLMVLCQHAEGERTRAALEVERAHVDSRIRMLDARLTDMQADANRKKLASVANPPLDPKRLVKASQELDQLIGKPPPAPTAATPAAPASAAPQAGSSADDALMTGPAGSGVSDIVRVCPGGHFYHRPGCKRVQKPTKPITRAEAERQGRKPCPTCRP
jgi:hypothetical protein